MRLKFSPTHEVFFKKSSDQTMTGTIQIQNPTSSAIFGYKIKCTNPQLFTVTPLKGSIKPGQIQTIQFKTNDPVNLDFAKQLVSHHKFLIQYVPIISELSLANFKNQQTQRKKYYINMDSIRTGSRLMKDGQKMSMHSQISQKKSYLSMKNQQNKPQFNGVSNRLHLHKLESKQQKSETTGRKFQSQPQTDQMQSKYTRLKQELDYLQRQRQQNMDKIYGTKQKNNGTLKKLVVFFLFLIIGYFIGGFANNFFQQRRLQQEIQKRNAQAQEPWRPFSFLDFLYDEVEDQEQY